MSGRGGSLAALLLLAAALGAGPGLPAAADEAPDLASRHFAAVETPSPDAPQPIGGYARGCLAGAVPLVGDDATFQTMRPSRNRHYGHPRTVRFVKEFAADAPGLGLTGLLVGDIGQPRGGPAPTGHKSHQTGLDVDIWFAQMPHPPLDAAGRETLPFVSMLTEDASAVDRDRLTEPYLRLLRRAAEDGRVARIFVHPLIKRALCDWEGAGEGAARAAWLRRVRPWYGHFEHFHVRLKCPPGARACRGQEAPPEGDGCGAPLDYWFTDAPYRPDPNAKPAPPLTLARMPQACRALVEAAD